MSKINRRNFIKLGGGAAVLAGTVSTIGCATKSSKGAARKKVVVVGGGTGGATVAKYLRLFDQSIDVTLIEADKSHYTCYGSNEVLSGYRKLSDIEFSYDGLKGHGVKVIHDWVTGIDPDARIIKTKSGESIAYDRAIISPGIDFKWEAIDGYDEAAAEKMPHAWQAGPQTAILQKQIEAMPNGGRVIIAPPPNPFRCPPGPYERASQIADYLKRHKPKSKILILDAKDKFAKKKLFIQGWKRLYGYGTPDSIIKFIPGSKGGKVTSVNVADMSVEGSNLDIFKGDVINIIPPQKAGKLAFAAGLTKGDWCPVNKNSFESEIHKNIHVLGDASNASKMPKSGYSANIQAKACASAIVQLFNDREPLVPSYQNTCYSIIGKDYGISVGMIYKYNKEKNMILPVKGAGGLTPMDASAENLKRESHYAHGWYKNITQDIFG